MPVGKSIRIYLADSTVTGIRYAELVNWTGQALACPRSRLNELKNWPEVSKPGVYFLFERRYGGTKPLAYIGESENVSERITSHDRKKDFWSEVVIFTSKDENLTKGHVKYLEANLVHLAKTADRYKLENGNTPTESGLPRADRDAMQEFVTNIRMVIGTLGYSILEPILKSSEENLDDGLGGAIGYQVSELANLTFSVNNLIAQGAVTDEGFVLKKNSQLSKRNSDSMPGKLATIKDELLMSGVLQDKGEYLVASEDILFNSSSYAAAIVAGTSRSGPQSWKTSSGVMLKTLEEKELENA